MDGNHVKRQRRWRWWCLAVMDNTCRLKYSFVWSPGRTGGGTRRSFKRIHRMVFISFRNSPRVRLIPTVRLPSCVPWMDISILYKIYVVLQLGAQYNGSKWKTFQKSRFIVPFIGNDSRWMAFILYELTAYWKCHNFGWHLYESFSFLFRGIQHIIGTHVNPFELSLLSRYVRGRWKLSYVSLSSRL